MQFLIAFAATGAAFIALDFLWLSALANRFYRPRLAEVMAAKAKLGPAIAFYLIYFAGTTLIAVWPAVTADAPTKALVTGAMLGLVAYATYNLTNWSTLKTWSSAVTVADMSWGAFATALASWAGAYAALSFA